MVPLLLFCCHCFAATVIVVVDPDRRFRCCSFAAAAAVISLSSIADAADRSTAVGQACEIGHCQLVVVGSIEIVCFLVCGVVEVCFFQFCSWAVPV